MPQINFVFLKNRDSSKGGAFDVQKPAVSGVVVMARIFCCVIEEEDVQLHFE
jgi:hypothetical protein